MSAKFANEAVFILQMRSTDAVRYISKNAGCSVEEAEKAFRSAITFHKAK
jgi:hypothetical protein